MVLARELAVIEEYPIRFDDYRNVDGVMLPFKQTSNSPTNGEIVTRVISVKHNVPIDDSIFRSKELKL